MVNETTTRRPSIIEKAKNTFSKITSGRRRDKVPIEALWPASLEDESGKAARILRSFFIDGFNVPSRTLTQVSTEVRSLPKLASP